MQVESFNQFIVVGDRMLLKPRSDEEMTASGLFLPPGVKEKEKIHSGYVIKVGPGYPIPQPSDDEPWKEGGEHIRYVPLQAREGDLAIYLQSMGHQIEFNGEKYVIVPQGAVLMLIRDEGLFE
jgi:co-chaperonin GroES (HSP10)